MCTWDEPSGLVGRGGRPAHLGGMPAELVAHRGDRLHRRAVVLAGREPGEQRTGYRRHGHGVVDRRLHGPTALAGVLRVTADLRERRVVVERRDEQVEQPRADDRALTPGAEDLGDVVDLADL